TLRQQALGALLLAASGGVITGYVDDAPLCIGIDLSALFLHCQKALRASFKGENSAIKSAHLIDKRPFEMQTGTDVWIDDLTEAQQYRPLTLGDDVDRLRSEEHSDREYSKTQHGSR